MRVLSAWRKTAYSLFLNKSYYFILNDFSNIYYALKVVILLCGREIFFSFDLAD